MHVLEMRIFHVMPDMWCKACGQFRPFGAFYDSSKGNGKYYVCKDCAKRAGRERVR